MLTKQEKTIDKIEEKKERIIDNLKGFAKDFVNCIANASFDVPLEDEALDASQSSEQQKVTTTEEATKDGNSTQEKAPETVNKQENPGESYSYVWSWLSSLVGYGSPTPPSSPDKVQAHSNKAVEKKS
ncbi:hypothetical protein [Legionella sp.]|uniref:hypothetical protein n=1 Tax=Legionella sp. TaxID=459 RepID=UPI000CB48E13|nr:hypothetical protein [Legionella sp.]PJE13987.1 MAG: hypothetical protein CK430_05830 [Legionella sp.]